MSTYNKLLQARCMALGFDPGPIDGIVGKQTREAVAAATGYQRAKGKPFQHVSGISRIHVHWTGGSYNAGSDDLKAYHILVDGALKIWEPHAHTNKLAHTKNANSGAIGLSMCGMAGAVERPFFKGKYPLKEEQVIAAAKIAAKWSKHYDIPISAYSILMHSEVQDRLNIKQNNKWDCNYLPQLGLVTAGVAGNFFRKLVMEYL